MPEIRLSVVVPTRNRKLLLGKLLDSLAQMKITANTMEVVVVDDGSTDGTREALEARQDSFQLKIVENPRPAGPSAARNLGVQASQGEIIGFLDSDVVVTPEWWRQASALFGDTKVAAVEGATLPPADAPAPTPFTHVVLNNRGRSYQTCNLLVRARLFREVGGFEERFCWRDRKGRLWHVREDTDLAFSILEKGYRIVFASQAVAYHPLVPAPRTVYLEKTYYGGMEALLRRRHPRLYRRELDWKNGRAFPVFYWGVYAGWPVAVAGWMASMPLLLGLAAGLAGFGWAGSVYAVCRKRRTGLADLAILVPQFFIIPWMRLFWVLVGEWKFRKIMPKV